MHVRMSDRVLEASGKMVGEEKLDELSELDERRLRSEPFENDFVGAPMKVHFAGSDFAQAGHGGLVVLDFDERIGALHELSCPGRSQDDKGKAVLFFFETIFDGDACHILKARA